MQTPYKAAILVVDHDEDMREVIDRQLTRLGYLVIKAQTAESALQAVYDLPIDLVLTAVDMPGRGGFALLDDLKGMRRHPPVALMTGNHRITEPFALERGAIALFFRPFDRVDLCRLIEKIFHKLAQRNGD